MKIKFDTKTMSPWHDVFRMLSNARSLKVEAGGQTYEGKAYLDDSDQGHLVLTFPAKVVRKKKVG